MEIEYKIKRQVEQVGPCRLEIECLEDLNDTIDQVFKYLEDNGNPQALEELCPYFGVIWPSARGLSEYLAQLPEGALKLKSVLELGCGLAIPSMIAEKKGARVTATDFHPVVPGFIRRNIHLNELKNIEYLHINWESEPPQLPLFDWVIGSDILYERRYAGPLAKNIAGRIHPRGTVVIADPGRPYLQNFVDEMKSWGFQCETQIFKVPHPPTWQEVFILIFKRIG